MSWAEAYNVIAGYIFYINRSTVTSFQVVIGLLQWVFLNCSFCNHSCLKLVKFRQVTFKIISLKIFQIISLLGVPLQ